MNNDSRRRTFLRGAGLAAGGAVFLGVSNAHAQSCGVPTNAVIKVVGNYSALRGLCSASLNVGDVIKVTNDGLSGEFIVKSSSSSVLAQDDKGTFIVFDDNNNWYAERVFNGVAVNAEWFADIAGDGNTDDSLALNRILGLGFSEVYLTSSEYKISDTIVIPGATSLISQRKSILRYYADKTGVILENPGANIIGVFFRVSSPDLTSTSCIQVGTTSNKANSCKIWDCNIVGWGNKTTVEGDGIFVKNGNFVRIDRCNIEEQGRSGIFVSSESGDANAGTIRDCYVNQCEHDAYHFEGHHEHPVSDWMCIAANALRFGRYGVSCSGRGVYFVGDIEHVGTSPNNFVADIHFDTGAFGNEVRVYPGNTVKFETAAEEANNLAYCRAGADPWFAQFGKKQFNDGFWINKRELEGELQFYQIADREYVINAAGANGPSKITLGNGTGELDHHIKGKVGIEPSGQAGLPSVHADDLYVSNPGNSGISIISGYANLGSLRYADSGGDSQGQINYDHDDDNMTLYANDVPCIQIDGNGSIGNTRFLIYDVEKGSFQRVSIGEDDSAGVGYRVLKIPN